MTPADIIKAHLTQADAEHPEWRVQNTAQSCFRLLQLALHKAGTEWAFIGKTATMDGASVSPPWFTPIVKTLRRPDGQFQAVLIAGLGMDAAWYLPTMQQVKVIANSSANDDPDPAIHGSARLTPYMIPEQSYRWHNPPVPQTGAGLPAPTPPPPVTPILSKGDAFAKLQALNAFYAAPEGLQRPGGMVRPDAHGRMVADMEAIAQWFYQLVIEGVTLEQVFTQIRSSDEWRGKHGQ